MSGSVPSACAHCLAPIPARVAVRGEVGEHGALFCCDGCKKVHALLHSEGLDDFYRRRQGWTPGPPEGVSDDPESLSSCVRVSGERFEADLVLSGIRCASCVWVLERYLGKQRGIRSVRVSLATSRCRVAWEPGFVDIGRIAGWIKELGYGAHRFEPSAPEEGLRTERRDLLLRLGTAAFLSSQIMLLSAALYAGYFQGIDLRYRTLFHLVALALATPVLFYSGFPFLRNAAASARRGAPGMDALVILGSGSAYVYSIAMIASGGEVYFDTTAMIVTLILLGRFLETSAKTRASETVSRLVRLAPRIARRVAGGDGDSAAATETVPADTLRRGDTVELRPGERIPVDGTVTGGASEADESALTGESRPVEKIPGTPVFAGTLNGGGRLLVRVTGTGPETILARIVRAVEEAQARRPAIQRTADRVVGFFVPGVLLLSAMTLAGWIAAGRPFRAALLAAISVLVVACPCALGLATPLAVFVGSTAARSRGIMVRGGDVLERGARVKAVCLDKTGTLTTGKPLLTDVRGLSIPSEELLATAAALEAPSEHALAEAIRDSAPAGNPHSVCDFRAHPGRGVEGSIGGVPYLLGHLEFLASRGAKIPPASEAEANRLSREGKTVVGLARGEDFLGLLAAADTPRAGAASCVTRLRNLGCTVSMLTGDSEGAAARIAGEAGIRRILSRRSPVEKAESIRAIRGKEGAVLMVGDGVNDAPALVEADVGVAMGRGTGVAIGSADAVLLREDLRLVEQLLALCRRSMRVIRQNLVWAFSYNLVALPAAAAGILHPIVSAGLMAASSLLVVGNSLRLSRPFPEAE